MKKYLTFPTITIGVLLLLTAIVVCTGNLNFDMFNPTKPKHFIEETLPPIAQAWTADMLHEKMPDLERETINSISADLQRVFGSCKVEDVTWKGTEMQTSISYLYTANLDCKNGKAVARLTVVPTKESYKYVSFYVSRRTE